MAHNHAGHLHGARADADRGKLALALGLIVAFMVVEVASGVIAHSLALLSDAGAHAHRRRRDRLLAAGACAWPRDRPAAR